MNLPTAAIAWGVIVGLATFYGIRLGYTGRLFALALGVAAALFAFEFFLAAPRVLERVRHLFGEHGAVLAPLVPLFAVLIYTFGVTGRLENGVARRGLCRVAGAARCQCIGKPARTWQDFAAVLLIWLPVGFRWMGRHIPLRAIPLPAATDAHADDFAGA